MEETGCLGRSFFDFTPEARRTRMKDHRRRFGKTCLVALAALLTFGAPAMADTSPSVFVGDGTLLAKGAAVSVPVQYTCDPSVATGDIGAVITERSGKEIVKGQAEAFPILCDGSPHTVVLTMTPQEGSGPFKKGQAFAQEFGQFCDQFFTCQNISDNTTITIH